MEKNQLKELAKRIMAIDHMGVQLDSPIHCEEFHQVILMLDRLEKSKAIRLLAHIIHVQQLQLEGADIELDERNPFRDMIEFEFLETYLNGYEPEPQLIKLDINLPSPLDTPMGC